MSSLVATRKARQAFPSARSGYRLQSPFATSDEHDRPVSSLHDTKALAKDDPVVAAHVPLKFDSFGRELKPGKGAGIGIHKPGRYNNAAQQAVIPGSWLKPPSFESREDMLRTRKKDPIPDPSFDLDGDGVVSPMEYFYALQFDKDKDGKLNEQERKACIDALSAGYGKQFYHVKASGPAPRPEFRILQRRGQVLAEEKDGWAPLHATYTKDDVQPAHSFAPFAASGKGGAADGLSPSDERRLVETQGIRTRSDLLRARRRNEARDLNRVGDKESPLADDASVASFVNTKPFNATSGSSAANRTQLLRKRAKDKLKHVLDATGMADVSGGLADTPRSDITDPGEGLTPGLPTLSRTRSELGMRKADLRRTEAAKFMPTKEPGVHQKPLPSYASALGEAKPWYQDGSHLATFKGTPWDGSDLDGSARHDETGKVKAGAGRRVCAVTGRALVGGPTRGVEVDYAPDSFKHRTTNLMSLPLQQKKRMEYVEKPTAVSHWDMSVKRPTKEFTMRRWTDVQIESQMVHEPSLLLDETGKERIYDPKEHAPLYSSFSADNIYRGPTVQSVRRGKGSTTTTAPRRRRSVYGTPVDVESGHAYVEADGSDEEEGDFFDAHHRVDYSRDRKIRASPGRSQTAPTASGAHLVSSPIAATSTAASRRGPAPGFGHDGADVRRPSSRPSSQPAAFEEAPQPASLTRTMSRQSKRHRMPGSGLSGSMGGASLLASSATPTEVAGVRSGGFQRTLATTMLVSE